MSSKNREATSASPGTILTPDWERRSIGSEAMEFAFETAVRLITPGHENPYRKRAAACQVPGGGHEAVTIPKIPERAS